jgi:sugar phosphate isomerase/epimerase
MVAAAMTGAAAAAAGPFFKRHGLPIGIQLYTLGPDAAKDLDGTLAAVSKIGFRSVELAGLVGRSAKEMRAALDRAGLVCTSAHIQARGGEGSFEGDLGKLADDLGALGVKTAVMPSPYVPDRLVQAAKGATGADYFRKLMGGMTADEFKMNADYLNRKAAGLKRSGIRVGYHNHNFEFAPLGQTSGYEILLNNTDPALVTFEMDVGWVAAAGVDPLSLLRRHKGRFSLMHVKDIKADTTANYDLRMDPAEIGSGKLDWKRLLPAVYAEGVRGFYLEQEPPFTRPRIEAAKIGHDYLAGVVA